MPSVRSAKEVIAALNLTPHPEKGYYVETFRDVPQTASDGQSSSHSTCIYYLLAGDSGLSHWHRVLHAAEVWHYYAGAPLRLSLSDDDGKPVRDVVLGSDLWNVSAHSLHLVPKYTILKMSPCAGPEATGHCTARRVAARTELG